MTAVLFVCTGNAARSQMAEGWLKKLKPQYSVLSAGTKPEGLSSKAIKAMQEVGLEISDQTSKHIDEVPWKTADFVITLCDSANGICVSMAWPETCKRMHWPIKDPVSYEDYRSARDEIKSKLENFLKSL